MNIKRQRVGADRIVWKWTDGEDHVLRVTNAFTVLSVRLSGDLDLDGEADAADKALHPALTDAYTGTGDAEGIFCAASLKMTAWGLELRSVALGTNGMPVVTGGKVIPGAIIPWGDSLSTYVPFDGGGAPNLASTSPRWVTFEVVTNAVTNSAALTMTKDDVDGFKVWDMDFGGATTNGAYAWLWQGTSAYLH